MPRRKSPLHTDVGRLAKAMKNLLEAIRLEGGQETHLLALAQDKAVCRAAARTILDLTKPVALPASPPPARRLPNCLTAIIGYRQPTVDDLRQLFDGVCGNRTKFEDCLYLRRAPGIPTRTRKIVFELARLQPGEADSVYGVNVALSKRRLRAATFEEMVAFIRLFGAQAFPGRPVAALGSALVRGITPWFPVVVRENGLRLSLRPNVSGDDCRYLAVQVECDYLETGDDDDE